MRGATTSERPKRASARCVEAATNDNEADGPLSTIYFCAGLTAPVCLGSVRPMAGCADPHWKQRLDEALRVDRAHGCVPICADGHGALDLHIDKSGAFYWKCTEPDCPPTNGIVNIPT